MLYSVLFMLERIIGYYRQHSANSAAGCSFGQKGSHYRAFLLLYGADRSTVKLTSNAVACHYIVRGSCGLDYEYIIKVSCTA